MPKSTFGGFSRGDLSRFRPDTRLYDMAQISHHINECVHVIHPVLSFSNLCNLLKNTHINRTRQTLHKFQSGMLHGGMDAKAVAEHVGVAASTISRLKCSFNETGRVQGRPRSERPKKTSAADDRYLVVTSHRNSFMSVTDLTESYGARVCATTAQIIRNQLHHSMITWQAFRQRHHFHDKPRSCTYRHLYSTSVMCANR